MIGSLAGQLLSKAAKVTPERCVAMLAALAVFTLINATSTARKLAAFRGEP